MRSLHNRIFMLMRPHERDHRYGAGLLLGLIYLMRPTAQSQGGLVALGRSQIHLGCKLEVPGQHGLLADLGLSCKHLFTTPQDTVAYTVCMHSLTVPEDVLKRLCSPQSGNFICSAGQERCQAVK